MFNQVSPESVGITSKKVLDFLKMLDSYGLQTHSLIMARGNDIFCECYYAPFDENFKHRMYSVSKSFVSVAVGLLIEDGLLSLDDKFIKFFPEYTDEKDDYDLSCTTIRDMLTMQTSHNEKVHWFESGTKDRTGEYFKIKSQKIPGTMFHYDSSGSYMLGVIVEKITGKPFLEFMQERFLNDIGFSKDAYCLQVPGGHSFGDSGVMCTARDLLKFARFVLNGGTWNGVRYMNREYLIAATSKQVDNGEMSPVSYNSYGYGYQIWKAPNDGFAFIGMGDQLAICDPKTDFIFVINSDNQGNPVSRHIIYHELYNSIINNFSNKIEENEAAYSVLKKYEKSRELTFAKGKYESESMKYSLSLGDLFFLEDNPMGIEFFAIEIFSNVGVFHFRNKHGDHELKFGLGHNIFGEFPETDCADTVAAVGVKGHRYKCACSGAWIEDKKFLIKVQIIDKYFANLYMRFSFKDESVHLEMMNAAEAFLQEYEGCANGRRFDLV